jgi:hypothetical protein
VPLGGTLDRELTAQPLVSVSSGAAIVEREQPDEQGNLEPPPAGEIVLSVPSPEALSRDPDEVRRVVERAGTGIEPLVIVIEDAEHLRDEELAPVVQAAARSPRPVILRVIRDA